MGALTTLPAARFLGLTPIKHSLPIFIKLEGTLTTQPTPRNALIQH